MVYKYRKHLFVIALVLVVILVWPYLNWQLRGSSHPEDYLTFRGAWDVSALEKAPGSEQAAAGLKTELDPDLPRITVTAEQPVADVEDHALDVRLDGVWYKVPYAPDSPPMEPHTLLPDPLEAGQSRTVTGETLERWYNWSKLPAGEYRLRWMGYAFPLEK